MRFFIFIPVLGLVLPGLPTGAIAGLLAVGHEFRPTAQQRREATPCTSADGVTASVRFHPYRPGCCGKPGDAIVEWQARDGSLEAGPVVANDTPASDSFAFGCTADGSVLVVWLEATTYRSRVSVVSRHRRPPRPSTPLCPDAACFGRGATVAALPGGGFLVAWPGLWVRHFSGDGVPREEPRRIEVSQQGAMSGQVAVGVDAAGNEVVAWRALRGYFGPDPGVRAVLLDESSSPEEIAVSEFPHGELHPVAVGVEGVRRFLVSWRNETMQGGWVARRVVSGDDSPDATTTTSTTTTTTLDPTVPAFLPGKALAEYPPTWWGGELDDRTALAADASGRWLAAWSLRFPFVSEDLGTYEYVFSSSNDDSRRWFAAQPIPSGRYEGSLGTALASDGAGVWILASWDSETIGLRRSTDGGTTWAEAGDLYPSRAPDYQPRQLALAAGAAGRWVAAWESEADGGVDGLCGVYEATSTDGGRTWQTPHMLGEVWCGGVTGLEIATDHAGNWLVAWAAGYVEGSSSADNAQTWSTPRSLLGEASYATQSMDLVAGSGTWMLAFTKWLYTSVGDSKSRVLVAHSNDQGRSWSSPVRIAPWHDDEGSRDSSPSLASDGKGLFGIAWTTNSGVGGIGMDADIVVAFSSDEGETWSIPRAVESREIGDTASDVSPKLAHGGPGTWGVLWRSHEYLDDGRHGGSVRYAYAPSGCGNGVLESCEQCDDANTFSGDGCDANCLSTACGNDILTAGEECDDGDDDETDSCISTCRAARCGDGFVRTGAEECDDGNESDADDCTAACKLPLCGDGHIQAGKEECDAASQDSNGACLRNCTVARCGDGYLQVGVEQCDDANSDDDDWCTTGCTFGPVCIDGTSAAERPTATDALRVLQNALGLDVECPLNRCDLDRSGRVTATDALETLRWSVALADYRCESKTKSFLIRLQSTELVGALQLVVDYRDAAGVIVGTGSRPDCELLADGFWATLHDAQSQFVRLGIVSLSGFQGPADVARCRFEGRAGLAAHEFEVTIEDATTPDFTEGIHPQIEVIPE